MSSAIINGKEIGQEIRKSVEVRVNALKATRNYTRFGSYFSWG